MIRVGALEKTLSILSKVSVISILEWKNLLQTTLKVTILIKFSKN